MRTRDRSFLEQHGQKWRVTINVPKHLQPIIGTTRLKQTLDTDSLAVANLMKGPVISALRKQLVNAARGQSGDTLIAEALAMRAAILKERRSGEDGRMTASELVDIRADQIRGPALSENVFTGEDVFDARRERSAAEFASIATGRATPLASRMDEWHAQAVNRANRTKGDDVRSLGYLSEWCCRNGVPATVEAITRLVAGRFVGDLPASASWAKRHGQRITNRTANKYISSLAGYWKFLVVRGVVSENVWRLQSLPKERFEDEDRERPFTRDEMVALLSGTPRMPELVPIMRIAALTGARLDAIVSLRVKDCANGAFRFKRQKRETRDRLVPIHSTLVQTVAGLAAGKSPDEALFPLFVAPKDGSQSERGMQATKAFRTYRDALGVDERREGRKRSLVNFHSFRRWFITEAERAGIPGSTIAAVVGHKRDGMTLGLYSAGPSMEQFKVCVEAVKLPDVKGRVSSTA